MDINTLIKQMAEQATEYAEMARQLACNEVEDDDEREWMVNKLAETPAFSAKADRLGTYLGHQNHPLALELKRKSWELSQVFVAE